ncbi:WcbI family polysaccharide biosynthesis putative acetyltransferase [Maridesulfovibrio sp.]|uniref:WcbI family polysaccharide biosynthesis putative acetyltransferase n=1 Tax=Maridesulfovibrio sp. TaxID=2795000 RepID=UPI002A18A691|nr:WcbI family polysaccharide biosynthesis putative acetyltransferase [Maridesulfovibrio sp.]
MKKKTCLIHANCQGEPLEELLLLSPDFKSRYEIKRFTNYLREPIPDELLAGCDLFLYQYLGENWGTLGSGSLCSRLKSSARSIAFPSMFFKTYWPLWTNTPGFDYRDIFLESLIERELTESQILHLYLNTRLDRIYNFKELTAESEAHEKHKETFTPIKYVDLIHSLFRQKRLFNTVNHPRRELMIHTADSILEMIGLPRLESETSDRFPQTFPDFELPIHPQVAEHLGLEFGGREDRYHVYGADLTLEEYVIRYIKCRLEGITDFIGFLCAAAERESCRSTD